MSPSVVKIAKPAGVPKPRIVPVITKPFNLALVGLPYLVLPAGTANTMSEPLLVAPSHIWSSLDERKDLFVSNGIHVSNNDELRSVGVIHDRNARNNEKGGLVMMTSASSRSCRTSSLWKSPSPSKDFHSTSRRSIRSSPVMSSVSV